jgi:hypothetical protein
LKFLNFFKTKNGMVEPTCEQFNRWNLANHPVEHVQLDDAGENKLLKARCQSPCWKLNVEFEIAARDAPQQNHCAELGFTVLANKGRAVMHQANMPLVLRCKPWRI